MVTSAPRRWGFATALVLAGSALGLGAAEVAIRALDPAPRVQIVRARPPDFELADLDGIPYWEEDRLRQHVDCVDLRPGSTRLLFLGDSIFYGQALQPSEVFTTLLEQRLNRQSPAPGFCVLNFSQRAFSGQQKLALARRLIPRYRPAIVFWEVWSEPALYTRLGDAAYRFWDVEVADDGLPSVFGLPPGWNAWLIQTSRLYEYATLALAPPRAHDSRLEMADFMDHALAEVRGLAANVGAQLVLEILPPLDRPFDGGGQPVHPLEAFVPDLARERGLDPVLLSRELAGEDYLRLRLDPCCHFNAEGHRVLADRFFHQVVQRLGLQVDVTRPTPDASGPF